MNFQSYMIGQENFQPEAVRDAGPQVHVRGTTTFVTTTDGEVVERSSGIDKGTTAELNPYHGTDSFAATARSPNGMPVTELLPTTLVTIDGVQAPVSFWVSEGRIEKAA